MAPWFYEEDLLMLIPMLLSSIPSTLFGIAAYVLTSWALYTIAVRRGLNNPWLSWIPVVNCWILGSLSDQYQYVVKGKNKSKRKILLSLSILTIVFCVTMIVLAIVLVELPYRREKEKDDAQRQQIIDEINRLKNQ